MSLKEILGHSDLRTTSRYTKALMEGKKKLVCGFEVSDNKLEILEINPNKLIAQEYLTIKN